MRPGTVAAGVRPVDLVGAEGAVGGASVRRRALAGRPGHDIDDAADGAGLKSQGGETPVDLDPLDDPQGNVAEVDGPGAGPVQRHAVEQHGDLFGRGAADRGGREAAGTAEATDADANGLLEQFRHAGRAVAKLRRVDHGDKSSPAGGIVLVGALTPDGHVVQPLGRGGESGRRQQERERGQGGGGPGVVAHGTQPTNRRTVRVPLASLSHESPAYRPLNGHGQGEQIRHRHDGPRRSRVQPSFRDFRLV